jgi:hypothetical protein
MDPNANLQSLREIVVTIQAINDACGDDGNYTDEQKLELCTLASRLAELVQALDQWIAHRGFLPNDWRYTIHAR